MKIILIIDNPLKSQEKKLLDTHLNSYTISSDDFDKHFHELPEVDCYIIKSTSTWWDWNLPMIKTKKIPSVYYSKGRLDNPEVLLTDFIITKFPKVAKDKEDLFMRLCHFSLPKPKTTCGLCCGLCLSQITMKNFCKSLFSCCQCL